MSEIQFSEDHEWVRVEGDVATIGISNFAQEQLGDVVFVELPAIGNVVVKGDEVAVVESVKAASEVYTPVSGEVIESNDALSEEPGRINAGAETDGWFFKVKLADAGELGDLMDAEAYAAFVEEQG